MKTLKMFGMAAIAVLMGVGFVSCSKENPDDDFSNEKKLVKMVCTDENGKDSEVYTCKYDSRGKLVESTGSFDYGEYSWTTQYAWGDNTIAANGEELPLKDGLIQTPMINYNSSNRIAKYDKSTIIWDGDKVVSISRGNSNLTFTYSDVSCKKGYCPLIPYLIFQYEEFFMAHPEVVGARTRQLPTNIGDISVTYEFDNEGYITKIYKNQSEPIILTWE